MKLIKRFTNKGKCKRLLANINEEMNYRIWAYNASNTPRAMRKHSGVWLKLYEWRKQLNL